MAISTSLRIGPLRFYSRPKSQKQRDAEALAAAVRRAQNIEDLTKTARFVGHATAVIAERAILASYSTDVDVKPMTAKESRKHDAAIARRNAS